MNVLWLNFVRLACVVFSLLVLCCGLIAYSIGKPAPLNFMQRLFIALPLLAIYNLITTHLKKKAAL